APFISILVPARNETDNIATCINSLRSQEYTNFEIIVLDDNSSDDTAAIVERIAAADPRVRLLNGKPLPHGWAGKTYACHQLAAEAKGDWLLFTDADTAHAPSMLRSALSHAVKNNLSLISGWPLQQCVSPVQKIVIPIFIFLLLSWMPLWLLQGARRPRFALTVGQFLFIPTQDYWEIGGHEAVKSRIIEDMWLGFNMVRHGKRQEAMDLSPVVSTRMYQGLGELWDGFTKWVYSVVRLSPWGLFLLMATGFCLFVAPFILLVWHLLPPQAPFGWLQLLIVQLLVIMIMRILVDNRFHHSRRYSVSHPVGISFMLLSCVYGAVRHLTGAGVRWKERLYKPGSEIN
ncbi:glycosyltransferase, partial [Chloroflexota bacterium]